MTKTVDDGQGEINNKLSECADRLHDVGAITDYIRAGAAVVQLSENQRRGYDLLLGQLLESLGCVERDLVDLSEQSEINLS